MPQKTCEKQLLLLTVPTRCDNEKKNESRSAVPGWTDTHCVLSCTRKCSSLDNGGSVKLTNVLKFDVAQMSPPVVDGSQSRAASVSSNPPMAAAPHQDKMPHVRVRLVARQDSEQPRTATHHTIKCGCDTGTDHTANNVDICTNASRLAPCTSVSRHLVTWRRKTSLR